MDLQNPIFTDEDKAREALEAVRWPNGPVCPHCGSTGDDVAKVEGTKKSHRPGLFYCNGCKGQFTVTVGTVFERSKVPLTKWWLATYLISESKKGYSAHQLHRTLKVSYKTAWFMMHRIREAMRTGGFSPIGGGGKVVEADETYIGRLQGVSKQRFGGAHKNIVLTLVERGGSARSFHIDSTKLNEVTKIVRENVHRDSVINTDEGKWYNALSKHFAGHDTVNHKREEYVRGDVT
jgi:transposase-like protein